MMNKHLKGNSQFEINLQKDNQQNIFSEEVMFASDNDKKSNNDGTGTGSVLPFTMQRAEIRSL